MKIVLTHVYREADLDDLRARLPDAEIVVKPDSLADALADADAVVCHRLTPEDTSRATRLRLVQSMSAGADAIDRAALPEGATFCVVGGHELAIAEWVLMAMLALPRQVVRLDRDLRRGVWHRHGDERLDLGTPELAGKTVAVIGWGQIGREVGRLAEAVGANVVPVSRSLGNLDALADVLAGADFGVVAVMLTPQTERLIRTRELDALGSTGYLVNVARGAVVDEDALFESLRDGRIAGAAIDVWWTYPTEPGEVVLPSKHPFHELENVLLAPHVSGRSKGSTRRRWEFIVSQLERLDRGEPLRNVVQSSRTISQESRLGTSA